MYLLGIKVDINTPGERSTLELLQMLVLEV